MLLVEALAVSILWGQLSTTLAVAEGMRILDTSITGLHDYPGVHACRGVLLDLAWRFQEAEAHFVRALENEPESVDVLLASGRHLLCMDRCEEAFQVLRRVLSLSPHTLHARMNLARALIQGGRPADAVEEPPTQFVDILAFSGLALSASISISLGVRLAPGLTSVVVLFTDFKKPVGKDI